MNIGIFFLFRNMSIEERKNAEGFEHLAKADKYLGINTDLVLN